MINSNDVLMELVTVTHTVPLSPEDVYTAQCKLLEAMYQEGCNAELCGEKSEIEYQIRKMKFNGCMSEKD